MLGSALAALACASLLSTLATAAVAPVQSLPRPAPVTALALTGANVALGLDDVPGDCEHAELWLQAQKVIRFGKKSGYPCSEGASTGEGIWDVAVAKRRVLWLSYVGGNLRDWQLWTATPTKRTPKRLRFVERDVEDPPPVVIGPGTPVGVPFAVDNDVTYLGDNGAPIFKAALARPVRALAAGPGPSGIRVAALLSSGRVAALDASGTIVTQFTYAPGEVKALRVAAGAVVVQVGTVVEFLVPGPGGAKVTLPAGALLADVAQGRILYERAGDLRARNVADGTDVLLVHGTAAKPVHGRLDAKGLAWTVDRTAHWRPGPLPGA